MGIGRNRTDPGVGLCHRRHAALAVGAEDDGIPAGLAAHHLGPLAGIDPGDGDGGIEVLAGGDRKPPLLAGERQGASPDLPRSQNRKNGTCPRKH